MDFTEWLEKSKGMSHKASHDVSSRLKRAKMILNTEDVIGEDVNKLESKEVFLELSMTVKSQLRRAIRLYVEFKDNH